MLIIFLPRRFYRCFLLFCLYFMISLLCFTMRPTPPARRHKLITTTQSYTTTDMTSGWSSSPFTSEMPITSTYWPAVNDSTIDPSYYDELNATVAEPTVSVRIKRPAPSPVTIPAITSPNPSPTSHHSTPRYRDYDDDDEEDCTLQKYETLRDYIRLGTEIGVVVGMVLYMAAAAREARFLGRKMFFENLVNLNSRL